MKKKTTTTRLWLWLDALFLCILCYAAYSFWHSLSTDAHNTLPSQWQWDVFVKYFAWHDSQGWHAGLLLKGLISTIRLGIWAGALALLVGLCMGIYLTIYTKGVIHSILYAVLIFLRNTPPLVLLFLLYFLTSENTFSFLNALVQHAPPLAQSVIEHLFAPPQALDRMLAAVLTLGFYQGAYVAEIVRAGLQSIPQGQWDAAAALGFTKRQQFSQVLLPQALPIMIPPLAGQYISIFKDSALAALISVPELTFQGMEIVAITRLPFEAWTLILVLYLGISLICTRCFSYAEKRLHWVQNK